MQGSTDGASGATSDTASIVTLHQNIVAAGAPNHFVALMPGQPFGALVPKENFPVPIRHRDAGLQAVQHRAEELWILKVRHSKKPEGVAGVLIGRKRSVLQSGSASTSLRSQPQ